MDIDNDNKCAACGRLRSSLPVKVISRTDEDGKEVSEEVQAFALWNAQWDVFICDDDLDVYNQVEPLASQWPMLVNMPDAQKTLLNQVFDIGDRAYPLFKKMTP